MTSLSIIVIAFHGDKWIPNCIHTLSLSVPKQTHLILVDNSENSVIEELDLSRFKAEILKSEKPLGFAEANNFALVKAHALGEVIVFLNQDTVTQNDWLSASIECLQSDPKIGAVTPLTKTYDWQGWDPYFLECARKSKEYARCSDAGLPLKKFYEVPVIPAAAMVVRKKVLQLVGPLDPIFHSYYEDYDLCRRIRCAGFKVGVSSTGAIAHFSGSATDTPAAEKQRARWVTRNRVILKQRETRGNRLFELVKYSLTVFPSGLLRSMLNRPMAKPTVPYLQAHWDLIKLFHRLVSESYDQSRWKRYLTEIGWPQPKVQDLLTVEKE